MKDGNTFNAAQDTTLPVSCNIEYHRITKWTILVFCDRK